MRNKILLIILALSESILLNAENWSKFSKMARPTIFQMQYAGNMGLTSFGLGRTFNKNKIETLLIYGTLPKQINGVGAQTLSLKATGRITQSAISKTCNLKTYTGIAIIRNFTNNVHLNFPDYYPDSYYDFPTALHAAPSIGAAVTWKQGNNIHTNTNYTLFTEFSSIDYYLINFFKNKNVKFTDIWNFSFGVSWKFR